MCPLVGTPLYHFTLTSGWLHTSSWLHTSGWFRTSGWLHNYSFNIKHTIVDVSPPLLSVAHYNSQACTHWLECTEQSRTDMCYLITTTQSTWLTAYSKWRSILNTKQLTYLYAITITSITQAAVALSRFGWCVVKYLNYTYKLCHTKGFWPVYPDLFLVVCVSTQHYHKGVGLDPKEDRTVT